MSLRSVARRQHVSHTSVRRSVLFARAVDTIAANVGEQPMALAGELILGQREVQQLAEIAEADPQLARMALDAIREGKKKQGEGKQKESSLIVRRVYEILTGEPQTGTKRSAAQQLYRFLSYLAGEIPRRREMAAAESVLDWIEEQVSIFRSTR
jgi:hypothetical protein